MSPDDMNHVLTFDRLLNFEGRAGRAWAVFVSMASAAHPDDFMHDIEARVRLAFLHVRAFDKVTDELREENEKAYKEAQQQMKLKEKKP